MRAGIEQLSDRASLSRPDPSLIAVLAKPTPEQFALFYRQAERLMAETLATSYANIFLLVAILTLLLAVAALWIRPPTRTEPKPKPADTPSVIRLQEPAGPVSPALVTIQRERVHS